MLGALLRQTKAYLILTIAVACLLMCLLVQTVHILGVNRSVHLVKILRQHNTGLFISPYGISELDCTTTKTDTAERSISIGRESLQVFFVLGALAYFQVPPQGGSREEKWRSQ